MARKSITVSELKCAVLDVEWRKKWLAGGNPSTLLFGTKGTQTVVTHGVRFHSDAEKIVDWLLSDPFFQKNAKTIDSDSLWQNIHDRLVADFLSELAMSGKDQEALEYAERLQAFCRQLIGLRVRRKDFENWQDVFLAKEMGIPSFELNETRYSVEIRGRIDAVRFHPQHAMEVVDYKLSQGSNQEHDMIQLAIYAKLLRTSQGTEDISGMLEYYLPHFSDVTVSPSDLSSLFQDVIDPVLVEMFGDSGGRDSESLVKPETPALATRDGVKSEEDETGRAIVSAYSSFKLPVEILSVKEAPQFYRFNLKPGSGVKVASLANRAEDLQVALSLNEPPLVKAAKGCVVIDLPKPSADVVLLRENFNAKLKSQLKGIASFPVGMGVDGEILSADFADPNTCHALVAGTSGSGKSEFLKSVVASLIFKHTPQSIRFGIVDPKILTFHGIGESPFLWKPVITDIGAAIELLREAVTEMDSRYRQLAKECYTSLSDRWKDGKTDLPLLVLVFDEFADLILSDKESKKTFEELAVRIAAKGRAAGIHLILATQRPDRNIVTGLIKANLPLKICLKVTASINSQIVLDETGAESLIGRGDLLCDAGKGIHRAQSFYIPQSEFIDLCLMGLPQ